MSGIMGRKKEQSILKNKPLIIAGRKRGGSAVAENLTDKFNTGSKQNLRLFLSAFLLSVLVLITYWNSFNNEFVDWDDYTYVVDNKLVRNTEATTIKDVFSEKVSLNYHPLTILSLRLNNNKCNSCPEGISAAPFIKWNVLIHILNTILVLLLIYMLSKGNLLVAFITAAIFGVHPMHVESVAWISERKDVLYSFFFLSGIITYIKYLNVKDSDRNKYLWLAATFLFFIFSCLSKAMAVVFPIVLILVRFWIFVPEATVPYKGSLRDVFSFKNLTIFIPLFAVSLFFGILAISINNLNTFSIWHRIQFASYGFIMYIVKFLLPLNQVPIYPYPTQAEFDTGMIGVILKLSPFIVIAFSALVFYSLRKTKLYLFGLGFYFLTVMTVLQFVSVGIAIIADRYTYLAYIGLAFIPAMLIGEKVSTKKIPLYILTAGIISFFMILSMNQIKVWRNSETLWSRMIEFYPVQETPRSLRGIYYSKMSKRTKDLNLKKLLEDKAMTDFKIAINAGTNRADVYEGAGIIYGERGDLDNAIRCLNKSIILKPAKGSAYFNRALTYSFLNKNEEAINDYNMALIYSPQKAVEILTNRSNLFMISGRFKEAIADYNYLISTNKNNYLFYYNRAIAQQQTNNITGAIADLQKALQLQPEDQTIRMQLQKLQAEKK
jgi:protein O-mannosyl-transferase